VGEYSPAFRHIGHAQARHLVGRRTRAVPAAYGNGAAGRPNVSHDGPYQGAFSHAVAPEQADRFAGSDTQADALQDMAFAIMRVYRIGHDQGAHSPSPR